MTDISSSVGTVTQYQSNLNATNGIESIRLGKGNFSRYNIKEVPNGYSNWGYSNKFKSATSSL